MSQVLVYSKRNREMSYLSTKEERETKLNRFQVVYNDISDEEALRRANSINLDKNNSVPQVRSKIQSIKEKKNAECLVCMVVIVISQEKMRYSTYSNAVLFLHNVKAY